MFSDLWNLTDLETLSETAREALNNRKNISTLVKSNSVLYLRPGIMSTSLTIETGQKEEHSPKPSLFQHKINQLYSRVLFLLMVL